VLVNNAGTSHRNRPMLEVDEETFDRVFDVNVKSIFHFAHAVVPHMRAQGGGAIINIGSTAGIRPRPGLAWYNASKGAVNLLSKSMAVELAPDKIRVCALAPVAGDTPLLAPSWARTRRRSAPPSRRRSRGDACRPDAVHTEMPRPL
jgi:3-oxoacyl-[acyl-carrier protein] reductase